MRRRFDKDHAFLMVDEQQNREEQDEVYLTNDVMVRQYAECKLDNNIRLKQVKNLEDLVKFNIKTVADQMVTDGLLVNPKSMKKGLHSLRKVIDPLLSSSKFPSLSQKAHQTQSQPRNTIKRNNKFEPFAKADTEMKIYDSTSIQHSSSNFKSIDTLPQIQHQSTGAIPTKTNFMQATNPSGEIHPLDKDDPIAKLKVFFNDSNAKQNDRRAPKHNNHIIQRIENQKKWEQERKLKTISVEQFPQKPKQSQFTIKQGDGAYNMQQNQLDKVFDSVTQMMNFRLNDLKKEKANMFMNSIKQLQKQVFQDREGSDKKMGESVYQSTVYQSEYLVQQKSLNVSVNDEELKAGQDYKSVLIIPKSSPQEQEKQINSIPSEIDPQKTRASILAIFDDKNKKEKDDRQMFLNDHRSKKEIQQPVKAEAAQPANSISMLSRIAATKNKDYIIYNDDQIKLYNMCIGQKQSQQRLNKNKQKREVYLEQKANEKQRANISQQPAKAPPIVKKAYAEDQLQIKALVLNPVTLKYQSSPKQSANEKSRFGSKTVSPARHNKKLYDLKQKEPVIKVDRSVNNSKSQESDRELNKQQNEFYSTLQTKRESQEKREKRIVKLNPIINAQHPYFSLTNKTNFDQLNMSYNTLALNIENANETYGGLANKLRNSISKKTNSLGAISELSFKSNNKQQADRNRLSINLDNANGKLTLEENTNIIFGEFNPRQSPSGKKLASSQFIQSLSDSVPTKLQEVQVNMIIEVQQKELTSLNQSDSKLVFTKRSREGVEMSLNELQQNFLTSKTEENQSRQSIEEQVLISNQVNEKKDRTTINAEQNLNLKVLTLVVTQESDQSSEQTRLISPAINSNTNVEATLAYTGRSPIKINEKKPIVKINSRRQSRGTSTLVDLTTSTVKTEKEIKYILGYESAAELQDDSRLKFANEFLMNAQYLKQGWHAKRFKKFPRFSIYLSKGDTKDFLERNYICLSNQVLHFLAQDETQKLQQEEPAEKVEYGQQTSQLFETIKSDVFVDLKRQSFSQSKAPSADAVRSIDATNELIAHEEYDSVFIDQKSSDHLEHEINTLQNSLQDTSNLNKDITEQTQDVTTFKAIYQKPPTAVGSISPQTQQEYFVNSVPLHEQRTDPFDKVLLLKNIDNAILTSYRTLSKQNNQISNTLKVLHQKFMPIPTSKRIAKLFRKAQNSLYPVSEVEEIADEDYEHSIVRDKNEDIPMSSIQSKSDEGSKLTTIQSPYKLVKRVESEIIRAQYKEGDDKANRCLTLINQEEKDGIESSRLFSHRSTEKAQQMRSKPLMMNNMKIEEDTQTMKKSSIITDSPEPLIPSYFINKSKSIIKIYTKPITNQDSDLTMELNMHNKFNRVNPDSTVSREKEINFVNMSGFINQPLQSAKSNFFPDRSISQYQKVAAIRSTSRGKTNELQMQIVKINLINPDDYFPAHLRKLKHKIGTPIATQTIEQAYPLVSYIHTQKVSGNSKIINAAISNKVTVMMPKMPERSQNFDTTFDSRVTESDVNKMSLLLAETIKGKVDASKQTMMQMSMQVIKEMSLDQELNSATQTKHGFNNPQQFDSNKLRPSKTQKNPLRSQKVTLEMSKFKKNRSPYEYNLRKGSQGTQGLASELDELTHLNSIKSNAEVRNVTIVKSKHLASYSEATNSPEVPTRMQSKHMHYQSLDLKEMILEHSNGIQTSKRQIQIDDPILNSSTFSDLQDSNIQHSLKPIQKEAVQVMTKPSEEPITIYEQIQTVSQGSITEKEAKQEDRKFKIKQMINHLYDKEKKFIYQKSGASREDNVGNQNCIFNLQKIHGVPLQNKYYAKAEEIQVEEDHTLIGHKVNIQEQPKRLI